MVYGPTPYDEIIAVGQDLQATAERSGALRAAAFASRLVGEGALLSGDLVLAERRPGRGQGPAPRAGCDRGGEAVALQRLAELRLAEGATAEAPRLLEQALTLARSSIIAPHLVQRVYGAMVRATARPERPPAPWSTGPSPRSGGTTPAAFCGAHVLGPRRAGLRRGGRSRSRRDRHLAAAEKAHVDRARRGRPPSTRRGRPGRRRSATRWATLAAGGRGRSELRRGANSPSTRPGAGRRRELLGDAGPPAPRRRTGIGGIRPAERTARGRCCRDRGRTGPSRRRRP